jgi:hypothetical protein
MREQSFRLGAGIARGHGAARGSMISYNWYFL